MVKPLVPSLVLLVALAVRSASGAEGIGDSAPPLYRYLIVFDTSAAMSRQKEVGVDTVNKLIASGINDRIQTGDLLGVWTVADKLNKNAYGPKLWVTGERMEHATQVSRILRDAKASKAANLGQAIGAIKESARVSGSLTVFLVTDGTVPIVGTAFDAEINDVFRQHSAALRKVGKPFVVVLVAQNGELVADGVSPGGGRLFIPPGTKPPPVVVSDDEVYGIKRESNPVAEATAAGISPEGVARSQTNAPKTLSAEEIAEILKEQQLARSNALAVAAAASAALSNSPVAQTVPVSRLAESNGTKGAPSGSGEVSRIPIDAPPSVAVPSATSTGATSGAGDKSPTLANLASGAAGRSDLPLSEPRPAVAAVPSPANGGASSEVETEVRPSAGPETATIIPPSSPAKSRRYLMFAAALFVFAAILSWLLLRWGRATSHPSLITRSLRERQR